MSAPLGMSDRLMRTRTSMLVFFGLLVLWVTQVHRLVMPGPAARDRLRVGLTARQTKATGSDAITSMRAVNPEWDFMRRTYVVLALANQALGAGRVDDALPAIDAIVDTTLEDERRLGASHFLLDYGRARPFVDREASSVFVDGELLLMMAARETIAPEPRYRTESRVRAARIEAAMRRSPTLSAESYPDECWTFCNTTALAALRTFDHVDGADHHALAQAWVAYAKLHLVDARTGLLVSSYTRDGRVLDGPEGSSLWMSAHNLLVVDDTFARDQYARARAELRSSFAGFGWAREWPRGAVHHPDVDSGPIVPLLDASAGSSGLAVLGASAFGDDAWSSELLTSLELVAVRTPEGDRYHASNAVGDAVVVYALSFGPLWARVKPSPERI
jgi:hypothetical protein